MENWKTHLLKLRKDYNFNNAIIVKEHFTRNCNGEFGLNSFICDEKHYKYYYWVCEQLIIDPINDERFLGNWIIKDTKPGGSGKTYTQKNKESKDQDYLIKFSVQEVINILKEEYPTFHFGVDLTFQTQLLEKILGKEPTTKNSSYIQPDGGLVYILINGKKHYILVSEQKRQGTNDERLKEGKEEQSYGNAIERLGKQLKACDVLFGDEDIYPFIAWLQGCDFYEPESNIPDRARTLFHFETENKIHLYWKQISKHVCSGGSYYMRGHSMYEESGTSDWTMDEMIPIMYEISKLSTDYYINKYN